MDPLLVTGGIEAPAIEAEAAAAKRRRISGFARTSSTVALTDSLVSSAWTSGWDISSMVGSLPWPSLPSPDSVVSERSSVVGSVGGSGRALLPLVRLILNDLDFRQLENLNLIRRNLLLHKLTQWVTSRSN